MSLRHQVFTLGLFLTSVLFVRAVPNSADADYAAFISLSQERPSETLQAEGAAKVVTWVDKNRHELAAAGLAFYNTYPADPRRWEVVLVLAKQPPLFVQSIGPDVETRGMAAVVVDEDAKQAWTKKIEQLTDSLIASPEVTVALREQAEWLRLFKDFLAAQEKGTKEGPGDFGPFLQRFMAHIEKYAALDVVVNRASSFLDQFDRCVPGAGEKAWRQLGSAGNAALRKKAADQLSFLAELSRPLDLTFTAVDGREVDLQRLRGKVVLIDFWATWCGPCVAELPDLKRVYAAYHEKGFEIIGVALQQTKLKPGDSPAEIATKLAKARKVLADFITTQAMPWPQYLSEKAGPNEISTRFNIQFIPAKFLLDQEGRVVSTNTTGEMLEQEVKRLLKL